MIVFLVTKLVLNAEPTKEAQPLVREMGLDCNFITTYQVRFDSITSCSRLDFSRYQFIKRFRNSHRHGGCRASCKFAGLDAQCGVTAARVYTLEKFSLCRNGTVNYSLSLAGIMGLRNMGRQEHYNRLWARQAPRPNYIFSKGRFTDEERVRLQGITDQGKTYFGNPSPPLLLSPAVMRDARREARRAGRSVNNAFRFVKHLGQGGQGMVSLWEYRPCRGQTHLFVLKVPTSTTTGNGPDAPEVPDTEAIRKESVTTNVGSRPPTETDKK